MGDAVNESTCLVVVATGQYIKYIPNLWADFKENFKPTEDTRMLVFTDSASRLPSEVAHVTWSRMGWPDDTMHRYHAFMKAETRLAQYDYLYHIDADMRIIGEVGPEILGDRVATIHPGFIGNGGTPERRPESAAYIPHGQPAQYFCGGFNGGRAEKVLEMALAVCTMVDTDFSKRMVPVWHDESCLNRFYLDNPPTKILDPSYCYPEGWSLPYEAKIVALNKDHAAMRR